MTGGCSMTHGQRVLEAQRIAYQMLTRVEHDQVLESLDMDATDEDAEAIRFMICTATLTVR